MQTPENTSENDLSADITEITEGELIRLMSDAGQSQDTIVEWLALRKEMIESKKAEARMKATLEDPVVQEAIRSADAYVRKRERLKSVSSVILSILFFGFIGWLFVRKFTG